MPILSETIKPKPTIFIASSTEGLDIARAVKDQFDNEADVDIWNEDIFRLNRSYLSELLNRASFYDFAIMIFTPDDELTIREQKTLAPRDNVVFEFGLYLGRLGPSRAFIIREETVRMFSDYQGISVATYRTRDNLVSAVGNACNKIRRIIADYNSNYEISFLPSTALAIGYYNNFIEKVVEALLEGKEMTLIEKVNGENREAKIPYSNLKRRIRILLPSKLLDLSPLTLKSKTRKFTQVSLNTAYRPFPFYLAGEFTEDVIEKEGILELFDIPTTLLASQKAIERVFDSSFLNQGNNRLRIEQREISNFEKTLRLHIPDNLEDTMITIESLEDISFKE